LSSKFIAYWQIDIPPEIYANIITDIQRLIMALRRDRATNKKTGTDAIREQENTKPRHEIKHTFK